MKKRIEEKVLLYNFNDTAAIEALLAEMKIKVIIPGEQAHKQKVGYLFGLKGFKENTQAAEKFDFPYELMMFYDFDKIRLSKVLQEMRSRDIKVPICKSVVTPFNRLWSLRRVCETMRKEHLAMQEAKKNAES